MSETKPKPRNFQGLKPRSTPGTLKAPKPKDMFLRADGLWEHTVSLWQTLAVDAIKDEALAKGWTPDELYGNTSTLPFPYGGKWGLVVMLTQNTDDKVDAKSQDYISAVTEDYIEIENVRHFHGEKVSSSASRLYKEKD